MSTPLSDILSLVAAHGKSQAAAFLQGEAVIAGSPDQEIWEHLARHDILWDGLTVDEQDQIRDQYLEAFKAEAARRITSSDPVTSPLPVSVAPAASFGVDAAFDCLKSIRPYIDGLAEGPHKTAMTKGWNFMVYGMEDPGAVTLHPDWLKSITGLASGASSVVPAPLVTEVVKVAQEGSVCEVEPLGEVNGDVIRYHDGDDLLTLVKWDAGFLTLAASNAVSLSRTQVTSLIAHLTAWLSTGSFDLKGLPSSPPSSEDKELLDWLESRLMGDGNGGWTLTITGRAWQSFRGSVLTARTKEVQQASTTPQKGGQGV